MVSKGNHGIEKSNSPFLPVAPKLPSLIQRIFTACFPADNRSRTGAEDVLFADFWKTVFSVSCCTACCCKTTLLLITGNNRKTTRTRPKTRAAEDRILTPKHMNGETRLIVEKTVASSTERVLPQGRQLHRDFDTQKSTRFTTHPPI